MVANNIVNWTIFKMCRDAERRHGSILRRFWWEQDFDLALALASDNDYHLITDNKKRNEIESAGVDR